MDGELLGGQAVDRAADAATARRDPGTLLGDELGGERIHDPG
jgi:hypothetical protein